jgi:hypothetical protein
MMPKPWRTSLTSTSDLREAVEGRRDRMERFLQNAIGEYELRFDFGDSDRITDGHLVLGMEPELVQNSQHRPLVGRVLHLLGHYLNETTEWWPVVRREEDQGRPYFVPLWHALEDARIENKLVERWPGADKFFKTKIPPNLSGSLIKLMATTQQVEMGLYLKGRGIPGPEWDTRVKEAFARTSKTIQNGAHGRTPRASLDAMIDIYPTVAPLLRGEHVAQSQPISMDMSSKTHATDQGDHGTDDLKEQLERSGSPDIETTDELVAAGLAGRQRELPEWFRPGSAPWFERGLGEKEVHPSAVRSDRETIVNPTQGDASLYRELLTEVKHDTGFLVRRLTSLLREEVYLRYGGHYRTGSLNTAKLWRQRLGVYRLFQRPVSGMERPVSFSLLVDESASMKGQDKYKLAMKTAILLGETLNQLDVPLEIIGFSTAEYEAQAALTLGLRPAYEYRTTRCSPLEHRIYKRFDEPYPFARSRLVDIQPRHNNWDEEHLLFAFQRIQKRPELRKVIVVISDGQPNGDAEYLIRTVEMIERMGCKVLGVGIGADFVKDIYANAIVVTDFRQLALELLEVLAGEFGKGTPREGYVPNRTHNLRAVN